MSIVPGGNIDINGAHGRITQHVVFEAWLSMVTRLTVPVGPKILRMRPTLALCRYHSPAFRELLRPSAFNHKLVRYRHGRHHAKPGNGKHQTLSVHSAQGTAG